MIFMVEGLTLFASLTRHFAALPLSLVVLRSPINDVVVSHANGSNGLRIQLVTATLYPNSLDGVNDEVQNSNFLHGQAALDNVGPLSAGRVA